MFDRLQKPFLTVETGEAYQPIRLTYDLFNKEKLLEILDGIHCIKKNTAPNSWTWEWKGECDEQHFESITAFRKDPNKILRLGTLTQSGNNLYINLPSFKRACLAVSFFHKTIDPKIACVQAADFINKVFGLDEKLPHGFTELFKEEELQRILNQRVEDYNKIKEKCEHAQTAEEAFNVLSDYTLSESKKPLPFAERYEFDVKNMQDPEIIFLSFYIFLRSRELVAIRRWFGESGYSLADAADETVEEVFGGVGIDIIE